jgi:GTPase Era involved in 16S rRNA processing
MKTYQQQRQQIIQLFQQIQALVTQNDRKDITKTLQESAERFINGKLFVVIAGEFKQGKSSLINALINEQDLFPVDIDITTNLVSTITYGKEEKVTVVLGEPGKGKTKTITREEIPNYVTEQKNNKNQKQAQLLVIESPNPQLKEGLVLVDTPGVGGLNTEHTAISYAFIPNADVVIFVSDSQKPMTAKELEFVEMINRHCQTFLFAITKKDVGNYQEIIDSNREKLSKTLNCAEETIKLIPVSSKTKLAYLKTQDQEDLADSNFTALETELWQILEQQRGSILSLRALADLGQALTQIKTPIEVKWSACQQSPEELVEIEQEVQEVQQRLQTLLKNNAIWNNKLNYGLQDIREEIFKIYRREMNEIYNQAEKDLDDPQILSNTEQLIGQLEVEIDSLAVKLSDQIGESASNLQQIIKQDTQLDK